MFDLVRRRLKKAKSSRGQIIIMVAAFAVALTAMVGLSIDLGYAFAQRRTVQNAADAAAIAGAQIVAEWSTSNPTLAAKPDVAKVVNLNKMGATTTQTFSCYYVDDLDVNLGGCSLPVPATATGIHIEVRETHPTFFIRVVPGAPQTASTSASATAHVEGVNAGADSPFLVCGIDTFLSSGGTMSLLIPATADVMPGEPPTAQLLAYSVPSGSTHPIVLASNSKNSTPTPTPTPTPGTTPTPGPTPTPGGSVGGGSSNYMINPAAIGQRFTLHAPHVADCGLGNQSFKGVASQDTNLNSTIPGWFNVENGVKAGPTRSRVNGINGCQAGQNPDNCILIVPIAVDYPPPSGGQFYVVNSAAFQVYSCGANCHEGVLLGSYQILTPTGLGPWTGSNGWKPGRGGVVSERLTR